MTDIEQKALALVEECSEYGALYKNYREVPNSLFHKALCRAIEQLEAEKAARAADRQEVSDVLEEVRYTTTWGIHPKLWRFIIAKPDPLVEAWDEAWKLPHNSADKLAVFRAAIEKRGGKLVWGESHD